MTKRVDDTARFLVNRGHAIFRSVTMTDLDVLLCEIAYMIADFTRGHVATPLPLLGFWPICVSGIAVP